MYFADCTAAMVAVTVIRSVHFDGKERKIERIIVMGTGRGLVSRNIFIIATTVMIKGLYIM